MNSVKKNYFYNICYQLLEIILPLILSPYLTRVIGAERLGTYSYVNSIAYYFVLIIVLGLKNYGNREIARIRDDKILCNRVFFEIYYFQLFMLIIMSIIYAIFSNFYFNGENRLLLNIQLIYVISAGFDINWYFFGLERFKLTVSRNAIIRTTSVVIIFVFVNGKSDLWKYTLIMALSSLLSQLYLWTIIKKELKIYKPDFASIMKHVPGNIKLFFPVLAISLYTIMDKIMLGYMIVSNTELAYYDYAEKMIRIPFMVITALGTVMLPRASNLVAKGNETKLLDNMNHSMKFTIFFGMACTFGIAVFAPIFVPIYYGSGFERCGYFTTLLAPVIIITSWANVVRTQYIIPHRMDRIYIISVASAAIVNFSMNIILIPKLQGIAAIISTIVAQFLVLFIQMYAVRKYCDIALWLKDAVSFVIIGFLMVLSIMAFFRVIDNIVLKLTFGICIGAIIYFILSFLYFRFIVKDSKYKLANLKKMIFK